METNSFVNRLKRQGITFRNIVAMPIIFFFVFMFASGLSAVVSPAVEAVEAVKISE